MLGLQAFAFIRISMMITFCIINHNFDGFIEKYDIVDKNTPFEKSFRSRGVACAQTEVSCLRLTRAA